MDSLSNSIFWSTYCTHTHRRSLVSAQQGWQAWNCKIRCLLFCLCLLFIQCVRARLGTGDTPKLNEPAIISRQKESQNFASVTWLHQVSHMITEKSYLGSIIIQINAAKFQKPARGQFCPQNQLYIPFQFKVDFDQFVALYQININGLRTKYDMSDL